MKIAFIAESMPNGVLGDQALKRGRVGHAYGGVGDRFMLTVGAPQAVQIAGVSGGIDKARAQDLRAALEQWIATA